MATRKWDLTSTTTGVTLGRYEEYKHRVEIVIPQLNTMKIKRIIDRAEYLLLTLSLKEINSLKDLEIFNSLNSVGMPGLYLAWDLERVMIKHLTDNHGLSYWRPHIIDNNFIDSFGGVGIYGPTGFKEVHDLSFDFLKCQGLACPFRFVPTYLNHTYPHIREIIKWRLKLGR